jgi:hypothetical protein
MSCLWSFITEYKIRVKPADGSCLTKQVRSALFHLSLGSRHLKALCDIS